MVLIFGLRLMRDDLANRFVGGDAGSLGCQGGNRENDESMNAERITHLDSFKVRIWLWLSYGLARRLALESCLSVLAASA
jgi:hypothetical protein